MSHRSQLERRRPSPVPMASIQDGGWAGVADRGQEGSVQRRSPIAQEPAAGWDSETQRERPQHVGHTFAQIPIFPNEPVVPSPPDPSVRPVAHHAARPPVRPLVGGLAVQRLVLRIGSDEFSVKNEENLVNIPEGSTDPTGSLRRPREDVAGPPLAQLGPNESIHIVGHGDGKGRIEGMDAVRFVTWLVSRGLRRSHTGAIRLVSCFSGTPTPEQVVMTEAVAHELRERGFSNPVIGFDGLVQVRETRIRVIQPSDVPQFESLSGALTRMTNEQLDIAFKPPKQQDFPDVKAWKEALERHKEELEALRKESESKRTEVEKLWKGQAIGRNIVYVKADPTAGQKVNPIGSPRIDAFLDALMSITSRDFEAGNISDERKRDALATAEARLNKADREAIAGNKQIERLLTLHLMSFPLIYYLKRLGFSS